MYNIRAFMDGGSDFGRSAGRTYQFLYERPGYSRVDRVIFHPMYDHYNFQYDLAVLRLETPVTTQTPIVLAAKESEFS